MDDILGLLAGVYILGLLPEAAGGGAFVPRHIVEHDLPPEWRDLPPEMQTKLQYLKWKANHQKAVELEQLTAKED